MRARLVALLQGETGQLHRRLGSVLVAAAIATTSAAILVPHIVSSAETANLWVDTTGGTCTDNASPVEYVDATACTWDAANDTCDNNDTVLVKGGSYGDVTLNGATSRTAMCLISSASGETVTISDFENGRIFSNAGTPWLTITGPMDFDSVRIDDTNNVTVDNIDMDATPLGDNAQAFHIENTTDFTLKNSDLHSCLNCQGLFWDAGGSDGLVLDHNNIYEDLNDTGGVIHTECIRLSTEVDVTLSRNHFWSCDVYDVFLAGTDLRTDYLIENNVFEQPLGPNNLGFAFRAGGSPSPVPDGMTIRYNVFSSAIQLPDGQPTANGLLVYGNYFRNGGPCGFTSNTTYSYNSAPTGQSVCSGSNSPTFSSASIDAGFVNPRTVTTSPEDHVEPPGDYTLLTGSPFKNIGHPSLFPALDIDGNTRPAGAAADIGASEFPGG